MTGSVTVLGSANIDRIVDVARFPLPGETIAGGEVRIAVGGKGLNQAVAAARQGVSTSFVGAVGDDEAGTMVMALLAAEGVDIHGVRAGAAPTGSAMILRDAAGENCIVVSAGANAEVSGELAAADNSDVLLMQLEIPVPSVADAARLWSGVVVLNAAPAHPLPGELWSAVDVLVVNETEQSCYGDAVDNARAVITTLGAQGCTVRDSEGVVTHIPGVPSTAVDTTGAGDTFCGVLAANLAAGADLVAAAARANLAAALSVRKRGISA